MTRHVARVAFDQRGAMDVAGPYDVRTTAQFDAMRRARELPLGSTGEAVGLLLEYPIAQR